MEPIKNFSDFDGKFTLKTNSEFPLTLVITYTEYDNLEYEVKNSNQKIIIELSPTAIELESVKVVGMISEKQKNLHYLWKPCL